MLDDFLDPAQESRRAKKAQQRAAVHSGGGDTGHAGSGVSSIRLGDDASATGDGGTAVGWFAVADATSATGLGDSAEATADRATSVGGYATATATSATAVGYNADAAHENSTAIGVDAATTRDDQVMVGTSWMQVSIPGRLNYPHVAAPTGTGDPSGTEGDVVFDGDYGYRKTVGGWKRWPLSTF